MNPFMPISDTMLVSALGLFSKVSMVLTGIVAAFFVMRMTLLVVQVGDIGSYTQVIKDNFIYFGLIQLFPEFAKIAIYSTASMAEKISFIPKPEVSQNVKFVFDHLFGDFVLLKMFGRVFDLFVNQMANAVYSSLIGLLLAIAPIVIFLNTILGLSHGIRSYFGTLLCLCLWPTLWNLLGILGNEIGSKIDQAPFAVCIFWLVISALQFFSPLYCGFLFKSLSSSGAITSATSTIVKAKLLGKFI